jgi:hypothetical protein
MKHRWAALALVLALSAFMAGSVQGQEGSSGAPGRERGSVKLGQNFPNPFNPETTIPFSVGDPPTCSDHGRLYRVSLRIYNVLAQLVAIPILQGGASNSASPAGTSVTNVELPCGQYTAYWDGKYQNTSREVASGIYLYRLDVDGQFVVKKMIVTK